MVFLLILAQSVDALGKLMSLKVIFIIYEEANTYHSAFLLALNLNLP